MPPQGGTRLLTAPSCPAAASTRFHSRQGPRGQRQYLAVTDTASEEQQTVLYVCGVHGIQTHRRDTGGQSGDQRQ